MLRDFIALTKPRTILLHVITASCAMFLASGGWPDPARFAFTIVGGASVAAASNAFNCYFDRDLDGFMPRTQKRPLPSGRLTPASALLLSFTLIIIGSFLLIKFVNLQAAGLALLAGLFYILVYTIWLKRRTWWSVITGSTAGAFPPLIGWVAATGSLAPAPFILAAIVMLWSPVHFWALAVFYRREYRQAGMMPMPNHVSGWIIFFSILLVGATLLLIPAGHMGLTYTIMAVLLDAGLIYLALRLKAEAGGRAGRRLFLFSILYLALLFLAMVLDVFI